MPSGFICGLVPGTTVAAKTTAPATIPAGPTVPTATGATLNNVSRPGQPFQAGDTFQLIVTGPPNSTVMGTGQQNANAPLDDELRNDERTGAIRHHGAVWHGQRGRVARKLASWFDHSRHVELHNLTRARCFGTGAVFEQAPSWCVSQGAIRMICLRRIGLGFRVVRWRACNFSNVRERSSIRT